MLEHLPTKNSSQERGREEKQAWEALICCMRTLLSAVRLDRMRQELFHREKGNAMATDHTPVHLDAVSHRCIETNGLRIHMAEQGTGPLLLLCHGFPELWYS
jgi:hypothetical protein